MTPGQIYNTEAYQQGKMLDHSRWYGQLPRLITPSDIDAVIDNYGDILMMEFSSKHTHWEALDKGQRWVYKSFVKAGKGSIRAVLATHNTPSDKQIDTYNAITSYTVMLLENEDITFAPIVEGVEKWQAFVKNYHKGNLIYKWPT